MLDFTYFCKFSEQRRRAKIMMAISTAVTSLITLIILLVHNQRGSDLSGGGGGGAWFSSLSRPDESCATLHLNCSPKPIQINRCNLLPRDTVALWRALQFLENCSTDYNRCTNTFNIHFSNITCFTEVHKDPVTACFNQRDKITSFSVDGGLVRDCGLLNGDVTEICGQLSGYFTA